MATVNRGTHSDHPHSTAKIADHPIHPMLIPFPIVCFVGTLVTDIVYVPLMTPLLAEAAAHGFKTVDGLGMLLHQAVPGFEAWFGTRPTVTPELRARVEATLGH